MDAEFINFFIQGSESVLSSVCCEETSRGNIFLNTQPYQREINIAVEIIGDLQGVVIYSMTLPTACSIASKMMMGFPVEQIDEMSQSALCELSNMISGNVATCFSGAKKIIDIKPPIFNNPSVGAGVEKFLCIPINMSGGNVLEINIFFKE